MASPRDTRRFAEEAARFTRERAGASATAPVDLAQIASTFGVRVRHRPDQPFDGRLGEHHGHWVIDIGRSEGPRARYSLAHEIGHLFLREVTPDEREWMDHATEERFCDSFAASLLLPAPWLRAEARRRPETLGTLTQIAQTADVSLSASLIGLRTYAGWRRSLLRFRFDADAWRLWGQAGVPFELRNSIRPTEQTSARIRLAARQPATTSIGPVQLSVDDRPVTAPAEISIFRRGAVIFIDLSEAPSTAPDVWAPRADQPGPYTDWFR